MRSLLGTVSGSESTKAKNASSAVADKTFSGNGLPNSRGGTRTHDPGIMSSDPAPRKDAPHSENAEQRGMKKHETE